MVMVLCPSQDLLAPDGRYSPKALPVQKGPVLQQHDPLLAPGPHLAEQRLVVAAGPPMCRLSLLEKRRGSGAAARLRLSLNRPKESRDRRRALSLLLQEEYDLRENIGQGSTSLVRAAVRRSDGERVAVKQLVVGSDPELVAIAHREFELLQRLQHPNIVRVLDLKAVDGHIAMVMERFDGCTVNQAVRAAPGGRLEEEDVWKLAQGLFSGLQYLHDSQVLHRDVKPQNIIISPDLKEIKLIDFNTAHDLGGGGLALTPTGTQLYASPEALAGNSPAEPADVWCAGLCLYFVLCGHLPQQRDDCDTSMSRLQAAACCQVDFSDGCWTDVSPACVAFLSRCLALDPSQRPSASELMSDPWLLR